LKNEKRDRRKTTPAEFGRWADVRDPEVLAQLNARASK